MMLLTVAGESLFAIMNPTGLLTKAIAELKALMGENEAADPDGAGGGVEEGPVPPEEGL